MATALAPALSLVAPSNARALPLGGAARPCHSLVSPPYGAARSLSTLRASAHGQRRISVVSAAAEPSVAEQASVATRPAKELVDELLQLINGSDRGAAMDEGSRQRVSALVEQLSAVGMDEPLKSPLIFGEWEVAYTSSPTAAGGYYRSALGRLLLRSSDLAQTISPPDIVGNRVVFDAFGLIPGRISLKGKLEPEDSKTVRVVFEAPTLQLGPATFSYGGESSVRLSVIYLDERVRLGRGGRGSLFVFVRRPAQAA